MGSSLLHGCYSLEDAVAVQSTPAQFVMDANCEGYLGITN